MKNSAASEFSHSNSDHLFKSLTADDIDALLLPFYLGLDFDARRRRFGGAISDSAIRQHCRGLNAGESIVLGCVKDVDLIAAIELHPLQPNWENAELALADCAAADRTMVVAHLLQLAAFAVGRRGCRALVIAGNCSERDFLTLLRGMGRVHVQSDVVRVELGEYADLYRV